MNCKYKVNIKDIQYNYKVKMEEIQSKYKFNIFCRGYDDSDIKGKIDDMYNAWPKVTGEGEQITLNDTVSAKMSLGLKGNISQEGTPTPDSPQPIHVVSGDNTVKVERKNIFNINDTYYHRYNADTISITGNSVYFKNVNNYNSNSYVWWNIPIEIGKEITISYGSMVQTSSNANNGIRYLLTDEPITTNIQSYDTVNIPNYKTITSTKKNLCLILRAGNNGEYTVSDLQVEYNSSKTDYLPYQRASYPVNLGAMELCKIGTYQDYIYKENNKWYKYGAIGKAVLNGTESWTYQSNVTAFYTPKHDMLRTTDYRGLLISDHFQTSKAVSNDIPDKRITGYSNLSQYPGQNWIYIKDTDFANASSLKTWLSTNNTVALYPLATPTTTEITDATLISQLEALKQAVSYSGQTNISQTNEDMPFIITASTLKDLSSLGTSTVSTLNTANVNRLQTPSISPSLNINNLELNNEDLELNNLEETIEETPEEE